MIILLIIIVGVLIIRSARKKSKEQKTQTIEKVEIARSEHLEKEKAQFESALNAIPTAPVGVDGEKQKVRATGEIVDLKYSNVTARSNREMLGEYIAIDIETCGLKTTDPVLEVSAIHFDGYEPIEMFTTLINPGRAIPPEATKINGITDEMVKDAPSIFAIMPSLNSFVKDLPIVGHNLPFDLKFLYRYGFEIGEKRKLFDTLDLAQRSLKRFTYDKDGDYKNGDVENHKLPTCCEYYGIPYFDAHRSAADAYVTGKLFAEIVRSKTE